MSSRNGQKACISRETLQRLFEKFITEDMRMTGWGEMAEVEELPIGFSEGAIRVLFLEVEQHFFKLAAGAVGTAYLESKATVDAQDVNRAVQILDKGLEELLEQ